MSEVVKCACGEPVGSNGRECPACWKARIGSLAFAYHPSKTRKEPKR